MKKIATYVANRTWPEHAWDTDMPFPAEVLSTGEWRGESHYQGPWQLIHSYRALAVEFCQTDETHFDRYNKVAILHGERSLLNPRESGYVLEGSVSIAGKKYRAFTSTMMFNVNGKLVDVAILHVCK